MAKIREQQKAKRLTNDKVYIVVHVYTVHVYYIASFIPVLSRRNVLLKCMGTRLVLWMLVMEESYL